MIDRAEQATNAAKYHEDGTTNIVNPFQIVGFREGVKWADEHPQSPWISAEERLPKRSGYKFTCTNDNGIPQCIGISFYDKSLNNWTDMEDSLTTVEYWMEIPKF